MEVEEESFSVDDEEKEIGKKEEYFNSDAKEKTEVNEECFNVKSEVKDPLEQVSSLDQSQVRIYGSKIILIFYFIHFLFC